MLREILNRMPLIAILRGVQPHEVEDMYHVLVEAGIRAIEVPLNSPEPLKSIARLASIAGSDCIIGAGTVVTVPDVDAVADVGGKLLVTPNTNVDVIKRGLERGMEPVPGFLTPTEAYRAVHAGAKTLKLFPGNAVGSGTVKAVKSILPKDVDVLAVGGIGAKTLAEWMDAGAFGIGVASDIYRVGDSAADVSQKAQTLVAAIHAYRAAQPS